MNTDRQKKILLGILVLVVAPAAIATALAGPPAGAAVPVGVIVAVLSSLSAGRRVARAGVPVVAAVGFVAALTAVSWPWVALVASCAATAGWLLRRGLGGPMLTVTLAATTIHRQPDLRSALVFGVFLAMGGIAGVAVAGRLAPDREAEPTAPDVRLPAPTIMAMLLGTAVGGGAAVGVALGWERAYWIPMTIIVLAHAVLAHHSDRIISRVAGTAAAVVVLVPAMQAILPFRAYALTGFALLVIALVIGTDRYWLFVLLLTTGLVLLLGPTSTDGVEGAAGQRLWGTTIGALLVVAVLVVADRLTEPAT